MGDWRGERLTGVGTGNGDDNNLLALESVVRLDLGRSATSGAIGELRRPRNVGEGGVGNLVALGDSLCRQPASNIRHHTNSSNRRESNRKTKSPSGGGESSSRGSRRNGGGDESPVGRKQTTRPGQSASSQGGQSGGDDELAYHFCDVR